MDLEERVLYFLIGTVIGGLIGYIIRVLQDTIGRDDVTFNSDEAEEKKKFKFTSAALLVVVVLTAYASFSSQKTSNSIQDTQEQLQLIASCNQKYLDQTVTALSERTTYTRSQADANLDLQRAQSIFLTVLVRQPPATPAEEDRATNEYYDTLTEFIEIAGLTAGKVAQNPFPEPAALASCYDQLP